MNIGPSVARSDIEHTNQLNALQRKLGVIEYVPIDSLTPYQGNPRKHPEKQIVKLMASIRKFGVAMPVLVDVNMAPAIVIFAIMPSVELTVGLRHFQTDDTFERIDLVVRGRRIQHIFVGWQMRRVPRVKSRQNGLMSSSNMGFG